MNINIPPTMKAVRFKSAGVVRCEPVQTPVIGERDVLLKILAAGLCQTDIHIRHDKLGAMPKDIILGHEIAGEIVALGDQVSQWKVGDRVVVHPCWACGVCPQCQAGRENACQASGQRSVPPPTPGVSTHGGMAEYAAVPASSLVNIGDLNPAFAAILADAGLAPYHSVRLTKDRLVPGTVATVIGVGGLGQFAVQMLKLLTGASIIAVDISERALESVTAYTDFQIKADAETAEKILTYTKNRGVEVVIDLVGNDQSLRLASSIVAPYGAIQVIGLSGGTIPFEATQNSTVELPWGATLMKPYSGTYKDLADVISLAQKGALVSNIQTYDLEDAVAAFDSLQCGEVCGRAVLIP
jgi:propanol-preferring alcohol dehydrogenase